MGQPDVYSFGHLRTYGGPTDDGAHHGYECPHCRRSVQGYVLAATLGRVRQSPAGLVIDAETRWLLCPGCDEGAVEVDGTIYPSIMPGLDVLGLPSTVEALYGECRNAAGNGAWTLVVMGCRALIMRVVADKDSDVARSGLSFKRSIEWLEQEGYLTPPMTPFAHKVRDAGNIANHEVWITEPKEGRAYLQLTGHLLQNIYGLEYEFGDDPTDP